MLVFFFGEVLTVWSASRALAFINCHWLFLYVSLALDWTVLSPFHMMIINTSNIAWHLLLNKKGITHNYLDIGSLLLVGSELTAKSVDG